MHVICRLTFIVCFWCLSTTSYSESSAELINHKNSINDEGEIVSKEVPSTDGLITLHDNNAVIPKAENVDLNKPINEEDIDNKAQYKKQYNDNAVLDKNDTDPSSTKSQASIESSLSNTNTRSNQESSLSDEEEKISGIDSGVDERKLATHTLLNGSITDQDNPSTNIQDLPKKDAFVLLGTEVPPATSTRLAWAPHQSFEGIYSATPVLVVNGRKAGPTLCLTASIHGDELNGIETVRRVLYNLDAESLSGTVVGVPIVNLQSFRRGSRYLSDRRDLNRFFPGDPSGSSASRIAHSFFNEVIKNCNAVVDIHTGSFYRTNLPQLRADLTNPKVVKLTQGFGSTVVLHSEGAVGTMRRAAVNAGIPTVTLEAGAPMVLDEDSVSQSVKGIESLLNQLDMVSRFSFWGDPAPAYYTSSWQRAQVGGIIFSKIKLGAKVSKGELLGTVTNPITNVRREIRSEYDGRVLGMALNQVVQPGFAAYHIGIRAPEENISKPEEVTHIQQTDESLPENQLSEEQISAEPLEFQATLEVQSDVEPPLFQDKATPLNNNDVDSE